MYKHGVYCGMMRTDEELRSHAVKNQSGKVETILLELQMTNCQTELMSMEKIAGASVNTVSCSILITEQVADEKLIQIIDLLIKKYPLLGMKANVTADRMLLSELPTGKYTITRLESTEAWEKWAFAKKNIPLDLNDQAARFLPFQISKQQSGILIQLHHLIADGWSLRLLYLQVQKFLQQKDDSAVGNESTKAWTELLEIGRTHGQSKAFQRDVRFWQQVFADQKDVVLLSESQGMDYTAKRSTFDLPDHIYNLVSEYARNKNLTHFSILMSAVAVAFYRLKAKERFFLGTLLANRMSAVEQATFGNLFNTALLPVAIKEKENFHTLAETIQNELLSLVRHQRISYTQIYEQYRIAGGAARSLFDVIVNYQDMTGCGNVKSSDFVWYGAASQLESLQINIEVQESLLRIHYDYRPDCLTAQELQCFHQRIIAALEDGLTNDRTSIHCLRQISGNDWDLIQQWNQTAHEYPYEDTLTSMFERNARLTPEAPALRFGNQMLTYSEFNKRANALARKLIAMDVKPGQIIGILTERSFDLLVAVYATLKCGAAYMPIGTDYPQERISFMLEDAGSPILLSQKKWNVTTPAAVQRVNVDQFDDGSYTGENINLSKPQDIAYVIYTSGSTGTPKGAMIQHKSAVNRISWMNRVFRMDDHDVILQKTPYTFDVSVWELFWWGMYNGSLAILAPEAHRDPEKIIEAVEQYNVTKMHFVPSMLAAFLDFTAMVGSTDRLSTLHQVFASGEALLPAHVQRFYSLLDGPELINLYGPTECTVDVSFHRCKRPAEGIIPIGKPVDNTQLYILDKWNQPVPLGESGELCIGGNLVGLGYLNRPELTADKFICNPFEKGKLYKTGDLARWNTNGEIEYLGRIDFQVKLHGQRIELGEIERRMTEFGPISQAVVLMRKSKTGDDFLAAYYTSPEQINEMELVSYLGTVMPAYMIPGAYMHLDDFPMTVSGKVDRKRLPSIEMKGTDESQQDIETKTALQKEFCTAFEQVLGMPENSVRIHDSFFKLGGTSLSAIILLTTLHSDYRFSLKDIYERSTPAELEKLYLSRDMYSNESSHDYSLDKVDKEINLIPIDPLVLENQASILLTGATGFLGVHLLHELVLTTKNLIVCLIRNPERLKTQWKYMFGNEPFPADRVSYICGDLSLDSFNLTDQDYQNLKTHVRCVYHAAADVRHFGVWEESYKTNTIGTQNIIRFCMESGAQLHHISTMSVNGYILTTMEPDHEEQFDENNLYIGQHYRDNIYVHSKYLAEKSVIDAIHKGLKANIYRVGNLLWRYSDGKFQRNRRSHDFYMLTQAFLKLGCYPEVLGELRVNFTPVDECAKAICLLSADELGHVWHMMNPNDMALSEYLNTLAGNAWRVLPMDQFITILEEYREDPIMGFLLAYAVVNKHVYSHEWPKQKNHITVQQLHSLGFEWSDPSNKYLQYVLEEE